MGYFFVELCRFGNQSLLLKLFVLLYELPVRHTRLSAMDDISNVNKPLIE